MKTNAQSVLSLGLVFLVVPGTLLNLSFGQIEKGTKRSVPTVLFVCEHGAAKSVIAAAYFDKLAKEKGLPYRATFRGANPDAVLNPVAKRGLEHDGIDTSGWKPTLVTQKDVEEASRVVTLGCLLPAGTRVGQQVTDWSDIPSPSQNYSDARDQIRKRVGKLVDDLAREEIAVKETR